MITIITATYYYISSAFKENVDSITINCVVPSQMIKKEFPASSLNAYVQKLYINVNHTL